MVEQHEEIQHSGLSDTSDAPPTPPAIRQDPTPTTPSRAPAAAIQRRQLPQYRVILHDDDINEIPFVVRTVLRLTPLNRTRATIVTLHAHYHGIALLLITHKERAELYQAQFRERGLRVTIEADAGC